MSRMPETVTGHIGLGGNVGDRAAILRRAVDMMDELPEVTVRKVSSFIETVPVGGPYGQDKFLNGAVARA